MAKMSDDDFLQQVNMAELDAISNSESYMPRQVEQMGAYLVCPNGYEQEGQSQVSSTEVRDVVGSDMPSLVRFFLSGNNIMEFKPGSENPADVAEANEKTAYVHYIIRNQPSAYKILYDFLMNIEVQSIASMHYAWEERKSTDTRKYTGLSFEELTLIDEDMSKEAETRGFEFELVKSKSTLSGEDIELDFDDEDLLIDPSTEFDVEIKITKTKKGVFLSNVPIEQMLITKNSPSKDDADLIGHRYMARRGDLQSQGFDKKKLADIPRQNNRTDSSMRSLRFKDQGGVSSTQAVSDSANDLLPVSNLYVLADYDGDGIPERRHVIKIGNEIFTNESFDHVPYAIGSALLMPGNLIGMSRAELTMQAQLLGTEVMRLIMDNGYGTGTGRMAVDTSKVDMDSLLTNRNSGVIEFDMDGGDIRAAMAQVDMPFYADKLMLISQYLDSKRVASTGEMLANQGLNADEIYNETATRFEGIESAGAAKVELVIRNIAELPFRDMFMGIAWLVSHNQSTKDEIMVLGKALTVNPLRWWTDHSLDARVGLGAGDGEKAVSNLSGVLQLQQGLKAQGSPLVDNQDIYNTLKKMLQAMGENQINEFFNDPENPEQSAQFLMERNEELMQMVQQLQEQQANPLAEAAVVEQQGKVAIAKGTLQLGVAKLEEEKRQFDLSEQSEITQKLLDLEEKYTALELQYSTNIEGKGANG